MVSWKQLVMVVGVTFLFLGSSAIPRVESDDPFERGSNLLDDVASNNVLTDEVRESPQSLDAFFLDHVFVWGTYENCTKNWIGSFDIWNGEPWFNLTIQVIGYGHYGSNDEYTWVHIEAYHVKAQRHLGIIGPHQCCIFAFGWLGVTVYGVRQ